LAQRKESEPSRESLAAFARSIGIAGIPEFRQSSSQLSRIGLTARRSEGRFPRLQNDEELPKEAAGCRIQVLG